MVFPSTLLAPSPRRSEHRASRVELVKGPDGKVLSSVERVTSVDSQQDAMVKVDTADADGASPEKKKMGGSSKLMSYMYSRTLIINIDLYPLTATNVYDTLHDISLLLGITSFVTVDKYPMTVSVLPVLYLSLYMQQATHIPSIYTRPRSVNPLIQPEWPQKPPQIDIPVMVGKIAAKYVHWERWRWRATFDPKCASSIHIALS